jgi:ParB family chromosome partitioning protein
MGEKLMARKNLLTGLTEPKLTAVNSDASLTLRPGPSFTSRGAVGTVTRSIEDLAARANAAKDLEARLTSGQVIVEIDPSKVDASFIADRVLQDDAEYQALRDSIAQGGQDSPILVRPHPITPERFQVAFGHRRLRVAKELERPVRAVIRQLSDRDLILAQGQENSARANLSFIERARFAYNLESNGYDRETIMLALSTDKTTVSRLITVVQRIPTNVVEAIGPAPATGRDRWVELSNAYQTNTQTDVLTTLLESTVFKTASSDDRFQKVLAWLERPVSSEANNSARPKPAQHWSHSTGVRIMKVAATERATVLTIDNRLAPGFDAYLLKQMENLYSAFLTGSDHEKRQNKKGSSA